MAPREIKVQCCVCGRIKTAGGWKQADDCEHTTRSHGYCPQCYQRAMTQVMNWKAVRRANHV